MIRRDADAGIRHFEQQPRLFCAIRQIAFRFDADVQRDVALVGKFDGVAEQIQQNLPQPLFIGANRRRQRRQRLVCEQHVFLLGSHADDAADAAQKRVKQELRRNDFQLARLDFRQIENIVDQRQQMLAALLDNPQAVGLQIGQAACLF